MTEHGIMMNERAEMEVCGVKNVMAFDEEAIVLDTNMGIMNIKGSGLHIINLTLNEGKVSMQGRIDAVEYKDPTIDIKAKSQNILKRILK